MRKLVLILIALMAVTFFIRAYENMEGQFPGTAVNIIAE